MAFGLYSIKKENFEQWRSRSLEDIEKIKNILDDKDLQPLPRKEERQKIYHHRASCTIRTEFLEEEAIIEIYGTKGRRNKARNTILKYVDLEI
jgi:hypothetical protein